MSAKAEYIIDQKGKRRAVVLPVEEYEELLQDLHDLAVVAERQAETTVPWEQVRDRLVDRQS